MYKISLIHQMTPEKFQASKKRRYGPLGLLSALAGLVLFAYFVKRAGVGEIAEGIKRLGAGFLIVLAISALRQVVRSCAWMMCLEPPYRLRFWDAFRARVMGDAIGNVLPFASFVVSEPAKPALIRDRLPLLAGFSAIAIENIFYGLSVALFVCSGMIALLLSFHLPKALRLASFVTFIVVPIVIGAIWFLIWKEWRFASRTISLLQRRGLNVKWIAKAVAFEDRIYGFYRRNRSRFLPIMLLEACFHLAGVLEIYVTLAFISPAQPPTLFTAFILESVNRVITLAFKFVPLRMGVDEAGTGRISLILQFTEATGVTLAIIRKARDLFWIAVGLILLLQRSISLRSVNRPAPPNDRPPPDFRHKEFVIPNNSFAHR